ncbi:hypothetical protein LCGC14_1178850, partial [marine sediment metagenome]
PKPVNLTFMSASPGGSWYPMAIGSAEIWQKNITDFQLSFTHTPGGGVANAQGVDEGIAQLAITTSVTIGQEPPKTPFARRAMTYGPGFSIWTSVS